VPPRRSGPFRDALSISGWPARPDCGRANGPSRGLADGSRFESLNLERVEPDHTSSRMKALAYRFDDPSY